MPSVAKLDGPVDAGGLALAVVEGACERGRHAFVQALLVKVEGVLEGGWCARKDGRPRENDSCAKVVEGFGVVEIWTAGGVGEVSGGGRGHARGDGHDVGGWSNRVGGHCCGSGGVGASRGCSCWYGLAATCAVGACLRRS